MRAVLSRPRGWATIGPVCLPAAMSGCSGGVGLSSIMICIQLFVLLLRLGALEAAACSTSILPYKLVYRMSQLGSRVPDPAFCCPP